MKKHFLILMLLTLLPLAGWAVLPANRVTTPTNISSGWNVALYVNNDVSDRATYTGAKVAPKVVLVDGGANYIDSEDFNVVWKDGNGNEISEDQIINVIPGGNYTVTVSGNDDVTYGNIPADKATASFWVTKATASITGANLPVIHDDQEWTGSPLDLLASEAVLDDNFNETAVIQYSIDPENESSWKAGMPKATKLPCILYGIGLKELTTLMVFLLKLLLKRLKLKVIILVPQPSLMFLHWLKTWSIHGMKQIRKL